MESLSRFLVACILLLQTVHLTQSKCVAKEGSGDCSGSRFTYSTVKTVSSSSETKSSTTSKSSSKTSSFGYHRTSDSGAGKSYSYNEHHYSFSSSSAHSHRNSTNTTETVTFVMSGNPQPAPEREAQHEAVASESAVPVEESVHVIEAATLSEPETDAPESSTQQLTSVSNPYDALEEASGPAAESQQESIFDILSVEPVVMEPSPTPSPSAPVQPKVSIKPPMEFYPCGYPKPVDPRHQEPTSSVTHYATPEGAPCPLNSPEPSPVPLPEKPVPSPVPVVEPVISPSPPQSPTIEQKTADGTCDSRVLARRVKNLVQTGNITGLAEIVIESDDIYGLNMGLRFSDEEREEALERTEQRAEDKDVIVLKALATAALSPEAKGKVIQLMVITATAPDGYDFSQHRTLVESLEEIFSDTELLHEVIVSVPPAHLKRRLLCAGCTPVNSYICAHCWPSEICSAYFWCPARRTPDESAKRSPKDNAKAEAEIEEPAAISEPAPRSDSIEDDNERAAAQPAGESSSNTNTQKPKKGTRKRTKSTKGRGKHRHRRRGQHKRTGRSLKLANGLQ